MLLALLSWLVSLLENFDYQRITAFQAGCPGSTTGEKKGLVEENGVQCTMRTNRVCHKSRIM